MTAALQYTHVRHTAIHESRYGDDSEQRRVCRPLSVHIIPYTSQVRRNQYVDLQRREA